MKYQAELAERAEMHLRHTDAATVHLGGRPKQLPGEAFQASATFYNEGITRRFRAVIVRHSVQGVEHESPYPDADFTLRWQTPNDDEWQPIIEGANAMVEVAWFNPPAKLIRFLGLRGLFWKQLRVVGEDGLVQGVIELQDERGARQRWQFFLRIDNGEFQMHAIDP